MYKGDFIGLWLLAFSYWPRKQQLTAIGYRLPAEKMPLTAVSFAKQKILNFQLSIINSGIGADSVEAAETMHIVPNPGCFIISIDLGAQGVLILLIQALEVSFG